MLFVALALTACGSDGGSGAAEPTATPEPAAAPSAEGLVPIAIAGPAETAALAAVPAALESQREAHIAAGGAWPEITGIEPVLTAYILRADMGDQLTLFEVRADGIVHSLYAYQRPFDSGSLIWSPNGSTTGRDAEPTSDGERAAIEAVRSAMTDAFEGETIRVSLYGYRFSFIKDGVLLMDAEIDPDGGSVGIVTYDGS
jgi:hypothetical protein